MVHHSEIVSIYFRWLDLLPTVATNSDTFSVQFIPFFFRSSAI